MKLYKLIHMWNPLVFKTLATKNFIVRMPSLRGVVTPCQISIWQIEIPLCSSWNHSLIINLKIRKKSKVKSIGCEHIFWCVWSIPLYKTWFLSSSLNGLRGTVVPRANGWVLSLSDARFFKSPLTRHDVIFVTQTLVCVIMKVQSHGICA